MWKKIFFIILGALLITIIGYQFTFLKMRKEREKKIEFEDNIEEQETDVILTGNGSDKITKNTKIIIESYNSEGRMIERQEGLAGAELIGNNRLDMLVYANSYKEKADDSELKSGLERMVLESYSADTVMLVKYYGEPEPEQGYFIGVKDNAVIVYLEDRSQVYEYTNIELWTLPQEIQSQLVEGIYVENEQELFDFLQTYSS